MKNVDTIQARFSVTIEILKNNFVKYLGINLWLTIFWLFIFWIFVGIAILTWVMAPIVTFFVNFFKWGLSLNWWGQRLWLFLPFLFVAFLFFWLINSSTFIANFYLTKAIVNWKDINLKEIFILSFKKLFSKAIVDLWYFLLYLLVFWIFVFLLVILIFVYDFHSFWLSFLFTIIFFVLFVLFYIIILVKYFFAYYYCFDKEDFSFSHFFSVSNLIKDKLSVFGNILLIGIISSAISNLLTMTIKIPVYTGYESILLIILLFFITYLIKMAVDLFSFIYFYVYYTYLSNWNNDIELEHDKKELNIKEL